MQHVADMLLEDFGGTADANIEYAVSVQTLVGMKRGDEATILVKFYLVIPLVQIVIVLGQPVWRSGQSGGLGIERSWVRNSLVPFGSSLR